MKKLTPRDKYLQKKYEITEEEYDEQLERQNGGCLICKAIAKARPLHVDHDHAVENWKILTEKVSKGKWRAWPAPPGIKESRLNFVEYAETKPLARAKVKAKLRRMSVRGILCWPCNKALAVFRDNAMKMLKAGGYIAEYTRWLNGSIAVTERDGFDLYDRPGD